MAQAARGKGGRRSLCWTGAKKAFPFDPSVILRKLITAEASHVTDISDNLRGAAFMMISMAGFVLNDAFMKGILVETPLFVAVFWRGLATIVLIGALCAWTGTFHWRPERRDLRFIGQRVGAEIATTICFLTALANMPLANATAILQSAPLIVTLAAFLFLSEPVGWPRLAAILIGFCGVLIIVRPGTAGFNAYALLARRPTRLRG